MLVLSRLAGEKINIGNGLVRLTILEVRGEKVRVGIDAPKDIPVNRQEIQDRIDGLTVPAVAGDQPAITPAQADTIPTSSVDS